MGALLRADWPLFADVGTMSTVADTSHLPALAGLGDSLAAAAGAVGWAGSLTRTEREVVLLARRGGEKLLLVFTAAGQPPAGYRGTPVRIELPGLSGVLLVCPLTHENAIAVRARVPGLAPAALGLAPAIGAGDRLGLATPGHLAGIAGSRLRPVLAQQSPREMGRTGRSPEQVLDDATWGVLQAGFRGGYGADADHVRTVEEIDACLRAGFTMYTLDPSGVVDGGADALTGGELEARFAGLPWEELGTTPQDCLRTYAGRSVALRDGGELRLSGGDVRVAAVKFGRAVARVAGLYRHLVARRGAADFDLEISVDETETPTTPAQHGYLAAELKRLGVRWTGLAPRFPGRLEKGVDYIGELAEFRAALARHVALARHFGPYKLSLHSGSDKFRLYPIVAEEGGGLVHVKTSGTSWLAALRVVAQVDPPLLREVLALARARYAEDRASYAVSAELARAADPQRVRDEELPTALDEFHTRQVLHVTYGSVLTARSSDGALPLRERLLARLRAHEELYTRLLAEHFRRHVAAFGAAGPAEPRPAGGRPGGATRGA